MAIKSQGTFVRYSNEVADSTAYGAATWETIGEVADVGEPSGEAADIDVTHLMSDAMEYLIGLPDNGAIQISGNFQPDDSGQLLLIAAEDDQDVRWLEINWSDGTIWYYKAFCKKYKPSASVNGKTPFSASFRTTGARNIV